MYGGEGEKVYKLPLLRDIINISLLPIGQNLEKLQELRLKRKYSIGKISRISGQSRSYIQQQLRRFGIDKEITYAWSAPYGWQWKDNRFQECPAEQAILREIFNLYAKGLRSRKIADELNRRNIPSRHMPHWGHKTIFNILKRGKKMNSS